MSESGRVSSGLWLNARDSIRHALDHFSELTRPKEKESDHHRKWALLSVHHAAECFCNMLLIQLNPKAAVQVDCRLALPEPTESAIHARTPGGIKITLPRRTPPAPPSSGASKGPQRNPCTRSCRPILRSQQRPCLYSEFCALRGDELERTRLALLISPLLSNWMCFPRFVTSGLRSTASLRKDCFVRNTQTRLSKSARIAAPIPYYMTIVKSALKIWLEFPALSARNRISSPPGNSV